MTALDKLFIIVTSLKSPKFENERQLVKIMDEILSIHEDIISSKRVTRKIRRRIKAVWKHQLPYDLYEKIGLLNGINARHIKMIIKEK